ncbi:hypothetical protein R6Q59_029234 [Mikania micrantha]
MPSSYRKKISDDQIRRSCLVQLTCYSDRCVDDLRSDAVFFRWLIRLGSVHQHLRSAIFCTRLRY